MTKFVQTKLLPRPLYAKTVSGTTTLYTDAARTVAAKLADFVCMEDAHPAIIIDEDTTNHITVTYPVLAVKMTKSAAGALTQVDFVYAGGASYAVATISITA